MAAGWPEEDDDVLLARIQDGSHDAFRALVYRHGERFYRLAFRYTQNRQAAEDVVQDAFLKLWEQPARWRPERGARFTTWFYRVVVNLCLDGQRRRRRPLAAVPAEPLLGSVEAPDTALLRGEEQRVLEQEIAALPERQRTALNLCFAEMLSNQQAAEVMGLSLKALQSLIMRAKTRLKQRMTSVLGGDS